MTLSTALKAKAIGRQLSTATYGGGSAEFSGKSAYEVLGISETSSEAEIKASFRKLAKENHPDVSPSSGDAAAASQRFLQILAAYEILSDSKSRIHYDSYLFSQRKIIRKKTGFGSVMHTRNSSIAIKKQVDIVEWVQCYRLIIEDILTQKKVVNGSGYFDKLESELYSAIRAAYYGPLVESLDLLPECFEAEERSIYETPEVLHLVSGRDLFGAVCLVEKVPELSHIQCEKITSFNSVASGVSQYVRQTIINCGSSDNVDNLEMEVRHHNNFISDVYKDLELHISGRVVATATRAPPNCKRKWIPTFDSEDHIHVFLHPDDDEAYATQAVYTDSSSPCSVSSKILLGTITGLGTTAEEGLCSVYDRSGTKTHVILKNRTLMVKHMHWFQVGDKVSGCECRCTRARLPPSKFWLFEPRCSMHDIGGWYIETFGRIKKGRTMASQRQWNTTIEHHEKRVHPAMYLVALAYRTLDLEDTRRRKQTVRNFLEPKLYSILQWCKKHL